MITMLSYVLFSYSTFDFRFTLSVFCTRSRFSTHTAHLLHPFSPASQLTLCLLRLFVFSRPIEHVSRNDRGQGHAGPFHETIHLKGPTTHCCTRRCRGSRHFVYATADIFGLLSTILHKEGENSCQSRC